MPDSPPPNWRSQFLGWRDNALTCVTERLATMARTPIGMRAMDLSHLVVIVSAKEASRQIREELARRTTAQGQVLFPPTFLTPSVLLRRADRTAASAVSVRMAWMEALQNMTAEDRAVLFPGGNQTGFPWLFSTSQEMENLSAELAGGGLSLNDAAAKAPLDEDERWEVLARLETAVDDILAGQTSLAQMRESAAHPRTDPQWEMWIAACAPDLPPLAVEALKNLSATLPGEVWIHAPESHRSGFTDFGAPRSSHWSDDSQHLPLPDDSARIFPDATAAARDALRQWARTTEDSGAPPLLCAADPEFTTPLIREAETHGLLLYSPEGAALGQLEFSLTIRAWLACVDGGSWQDAHRFWMLPAPAAVLRDLTGCSTEHLLRLSDRYQEKSLPAGLLGPLPEEEGLRQAMSWMQPWIKRWKASPWRSVLTDFCAELFGNRHVSPSRPEDEAFVTSWRIWEDSLRQVEGDPFDAIDAAKFLLGFVDPQKAQTPGRDAHTDVPGWLEVSWRKGRSVVYGGLHEGSVPEAVRPGPWLTDAARRSLGLPSDRTRLARDHFLLRAALACRPDGVTVLLWRQNSQGEPLRPSRLLFATDQEQLIRRVRHLYGEEAAATPTRRAGRAWKFTPLLPETPKLPETLSPHHIHAYLTCPFRFYLKYVRDASAFDPYPLELSSADFGSLLHDALEVWADPDHAISGEKALVESALERLDEIFARQFPGDPSLILQIQRAWMEQRLRAAARVEAASRLEGWTPGGGETKLTGRDELVVHGMPLGGILDRWDKRANTIRVVDYKTGQPKSVRDVLFTTKEPRQDQPWRVADFPHKNPLYWNNVQLPLYALLLAQREQKPVEEIAWFMLPEISGKCDYLKLPLDAPLLDSLKTCVTGVAESIRDGVFWPPSEELPFDDLKTWLPADFSLRAEGEPFDQAIRNLYQNSR